MKAKTTLSIMFTLIMSVMFAQKTYVTANSADISDQLDLRAVATLFGESRDLQEFERNLNDPQLQISNLDLNGDNYVDYLRVIEHQDRNTHVIIIQAVLERDVFQDVATIEVESNRRRRNAQVQIVGNPYIYGNNFIIEPMFAYTPVIYNHFWAPVYNVYVSPWSWGYYPTYYSPWQPCDIYFYYGHANYWAGYHNFYYVNYRRSNRAQRVYNIHYTNTYYTLHPNRSFVNRNQNVRNAYTLQQSRGDRDYRQVATRETSTIRGVERIASNRDTSNNRQTVDRNTTNGREVQTGDRDVNTNSRESLDRTATNSREVQTGGREVNTNGRESVDRTSTDNRERQTDGREAAVSGRETLSSKPAFDNNHVNRQETTTRPATTNRVESSQQPTNRQVEPASGRQTVAPQNNTNNINNRPQSVNRQAAPAPARQTAAPKPKNTRETAVPSRNNDRSSTPASSGRTGSGRG